MYKSRQDEIDSEFNKHKVTSVECSLENITIATTVNNIKTIDMGECENNDIDF